MDLRLHTREVAEVADLGMTWHRANALLDTGVLQLYHLPYDQALSTVRRRAVTSKQNETTGAWTWCKTWHRTNALDTGTSLPSLLKEGFKHEHMRAQMEPCNPPCCMELNWCSLSKDYVIAGNEGCTLISKGLAGRLGLLDARGMPMGGNGRTFPVHGVVAGASERIPVISFTYRIKGAQDCCPSCPQQSIS